jgi:hypothetical protein
MSQWAEKSAPFSEKSHFGGHLIAYKIPPREQFHKLCALGVLDEVNKHMKLKKKENIYPGTYPLTLIYPISA